jgi:vacuolar-type H+-ATPase subunit H
MPSDWEMLIEAAQQEGVLSVEAAEQWRRYILEEAYQEYQERYAEWRAEKGILRQGEKVE